MTNPNGGVVDVRCSSGACGAAGVAYRCDAIAPLCSRGWCLEWPSPLPFAMRLYAAPRSSAVYGQVMSGAVLRISDAGWTVIPAPEGKIFGRLFPVDGRVLYGVSGWYGEELSRFDGTAWRIVQHPAEASTVDAVVERSPDDVWIAARQYRDTDSVLYHWDGRAWTKGVAVGMYAVAVGRIGDEDYIGSQDGALVRVRPEADGSHPRLAAPRQLRGFWGSSADDVWADAQPGLVHYDGATWTPVGGDGRSIHSSARLWLPGENGARYWDGQKLSDVALDSEIVSVVTAAGGGHGFATGFGGAMWELTPQGARRLVETPSAHRFSADLLSVGPDDVLVGGNGGDLHRVAAGRLTAVPKVPDCPAAVWHAGDRVYARMGTSPEMLYAFDGSRWTATGLTEVTDVWTPRAGVAWAVGDSGVFELDATRGLWRRHTAVAGGASVLGFAGDDVWVSAADRVFHYDGSAWTPTALAGAQRLGEITGRSGSMWIADVPGLHHFDGTRSTLHAWPAPGKLVALAGNASEVFAVLGDNYWERRLFRFDGSTWQEERHVPVVSVGASPVDDGIWASSESGLYRRSSQGWQQVAATYEWNRREALSGTSEADVWAVGNRALHRTASGWAEVPTPAFGPLLGVSAVSPSEAWAVGRRGQILRWDGAAWSHAPSPVVDDLNSVSVRGGDGWAAGESGAVLRLDPASRTWSEWPRFTSDRLVALHTRGPEDAWATTVRAVYRFDGVRWAAVSSPMGPQFAPLFAAPTGPVWVGGMQPALQVWTGAGWQAESVPLTSIEPVPTSRMFEAGFAFDETHAIAGGFEGFATRDESGWHREPCDLLPGAGALWGTGPGNVWAVSGSIAHKLVR